MPTWQAPHCRSAVFVPSADFPWPEGQVDTAVQASPSSAVLKLISATQFSHVRSALALPASSCPWPAAQVRQVAHPTPAPVLNLSPTQAPQEALDDATAVPVPMLQFLQAVCAVPS